MNGTTETFSLWYFLYTCSRFRVSWVLRKHRREAYIGTAKPRGNVIRDSTMWLGGRHREGLMVGKEPSSLECRPLSISGASVFEGR